MNPDREMPPIIAQGRHRHFLRVVLFALLQSAAVAMAAFATRRLFAHLHEGGTGQPLLALMLVVLSGLLMAVAKLLGSRAAEALGQDYIAQLRVVLYRHLARLSVRSLSRRRSGGVTLRFVGDLSAVRNWVSLGMTRLLVSAVLLPLAAFTLWWLHPALAAAVAVPLLIGIAMLYLVGLWLGPAHQQLRRMRARIAVDMSERAISAAALHAMGRTSKELQRLQSRTLSLREAALQRTSWAALARAVPDACLGVASACLLWTAIVRRIEPATVAAALAVLGMIIHPLRELASVQNRYHAWCAARARCLALLEMPRLPLVRAERAADAEAGSAGASLCVREARVAGGGTLALNLEPGERAALVGPNGAGKTLLLQALAGLDTLEAGLVLIEGQSPFQYRASAPGRCVLLAPYSPILAGSLRLALTLGIARRPADEDIRAVALEYGLGACLERLKGLDGRIAEGGRNLSAGERVRLLMARAALLKPRLLLIDGIDAYLDDQAPVLLARLFGQTGATVLLVSHRPDVLAIMPRRVGMA